MSRFEEFRNDPDDPRHGLVSSYTNMGCRCPRCTAAATEYQREYKRRRRENEGLALGHAQLVRKINQRQEVKMDEPDKFWWHFTGQEWLPRWGEEMLGKDF